MLFQLQMQTGRCRRGRYPRSCQTIQEHTTHCLARPFRPDSAPSKKVLKGPFFRALARAATHAGPTRHPRTQRRPCQVAWPGLPEALTSLQPCLPPSVCLPAPTAGSHVRGLPLAAGVTRALPSPGNWRPASVPRDAEPAPRAPSSHSTARAALPLSVAPEPADSRLSPAKGPGQGQEASAGTRHRQCR